MDLEEQLIEALSKDDNLDELYERSKFQLDQLQKAKLEYDNFLMREIQIHFQSSEQTTHLDLRQCLVEYSRLINNEQSNIYINLESCNQDVDLLEEIIMTYDVQIVNDLNQRLQQCHQFIMSIEEFIQVTLIFMKNKIKYMDANYLSDDRLVQYDNIKKLKGKLLSDPLAIESSKLINSMKLYHKELINSLQYHQNMYVKQNLLIDNDDEQENQIIQFSINLSVYKWVIMNKIILEKEEVSNNMITQLIMLIWQRLDRIQLQGFTSLDPVIPSIKFQSNQDLNQIILISFNPQLTNNEQFFEQFNQILGMVIEIGNILELNLLSRIQDKLQNKFKQILIQVLENAIDLTMRDQIKITIINQLQQLNFRSIPIFDFFTLLNVPTLLEKYSQLSIIEQIDQSLINIKNQIVAQNQILITNIQLFIKPIEQSKSKSDKIKSLIFKKSNSESIKKQQPSFQIGQEAQKIQSKYFQALTQILNHIQELSQKSSQQPPDEQCKLFKRLWIHFVLIKFLINDLDRNIKVKQFHYLNFFVSILTYIDESIKEFIQNIYTLKVINDIQSQDITLLIQECIEFQIAFKRNLLNYNKILNDERKLEFNNEKL